MTLYVIHRINREELPGDENLELPPMVGIKVFPLRDSHGEYHTIDAASGEEAFAAVKLLWPFLRFNLCVQPLTEYQNDLARFATYKADRLAGRIPPRGKSSGLHPRSTANRAGD